MVAERGQPPTLIRRLKLSTMVAAKVEYRQSPLYTMAAANAEHMFCTGGHYFYHGSCQFRKLAVMSVMTQHTLLLNVISIKIIPILFAPLGNPSFRIHSKTTSGQKTKVVRLKLLVCLLWAKDLTTAYGEPTGLLTSSLLLRATFCMQY